MGTGLGRTAFAPAKIMHYNADATCNVQHRPCPQLQVALTAAFAPFWSGLNYNVVDFFRLHAGVSCNMPRRHGPGCLSVGFFGQHGARRMARHPSCNLHCGTCCTTAAVYGIRNTQAQPAATDDVGYNMQHTTYKHTNTQHAARRCPLAACAWRTRRRAMLCARIAATLPCAHQWCMFPHFTSCDAACVLRARPSAARARSSA